MPYNIRQQKKLLESRINELTKGSLMQDTEFETEFETNYGTVRKLMESPTNFITQPKL
jgi:hypothetical protein